MTPVTGLRSLACRVIPRNVPIGVRIVGAFVAIALLAGSLAFVAVTATGRAASLLDGDLVAVNTLADTRLRIARIEHHVLHVIMQHHDSADHVIELQETDRAVDAALAEYRRAPGAPRAGDARLVDDLADRYRALSEARRDLFHLVEAGRVQDATARVLGPWQEIYADAMAAGDRLLTATSAEISRAAAAASAQAMTGRHLVITLALFSIGASLLLAVGITRSITRPLATLMAATQIARQGELRPTGAAGTRDEIGRLGRSFDEMIATLGRMLEQQRDFLADVSHELKTPLTIITGEAQVALRGPEKTAAEYSDALRVIASASEDMTRLVERLLFLARTRAGQIPYEMTTLDLDEVVNAAHRQSHVLAERKGIVLTVKLGRAAQVRGDAERLKDLLVILLDNAIKYTPPGGGVTVELAADRQRAFVRVADSGVGIPPESLPFIFRRFYRAGPHATKSGEGAGVGLAIAQAIVEAHGGEIFVDSQPGKGSTFTVTLPRVTLPRVDAA